MLTDEQLELRALARDFAERELRPHVEAWDQKGTLPEALFQELAESGFLGLRVPESEGGLGLDLTTALLVVEALSWGEASVGLAVGIHVGPLTSTLLRAGSLEQRTQWLPRLADGSVRGAVAFSEAEAGSDLASLTLAATPTPSGGWKLSGEKSWVTGGGRAGLLLVAARTGGEGSEGISLFLVPGDVTGLRVGERERTMGLRPSEIVTLHFEDVELPASALLGAPGEGWGLIRAGLTEGRLFVAAQALGIGQAALDHALRYAGEREQFGQPLHGFGAIQEKLAGMAIRVGSARALLYDAARGAEGEGQDPSLHTPMAPEAQAAMAKVAASEAALWSADEAVQVFGGYGYMRDYPVEKLMRDAKGTEIYEGANELLREVIARALVRERG